MTEMQDAFHRLAPYLADISVSDEGIIEYADRRFVFFHTPMFARLFENMVEVTGPVIEREIQEFGEQAGQDIARKMDAAFSEVSLTELLTLLVRSRFDVRSLRALRPTDTESMLQKIFGYGTHVGWLGNVDIVSYQEEERLVTDIENSFEPYSYGETGEQECAFTLGVMKGILMYYWETDDLSVREESCICAGDDACRIVVEHDEA